MRGRPLISFRALSRRLLYLKKAPLERVLQAGLFRRRHLLTGVPFGFGLVAIFIEPIRPAELLQDRRSIALFSPATRTRIQFRCDSFHARVHVTHTQQWCVDAHAVEEARELRSAGAGYRCAIGDCVNIEVERVED
jgi:hypothetical protein